MSTKYKATTTDQAYFITITTVGWVDIFTRLNQKYNIVNALQYCQEKKGLEIYAYCIMSCTEIGLHKSVKIWNDIQE
jgi:REP element-mobilizing transposase RayT